jgi:hypothetical protein
MDVNIARAHHRGCGVSGRGFGVLAAQMSFTSAMTMPAVTKTTIATCIQIQVGDTTARATRRGA